VPVIFKKYLTYSELGVMMMCTAPFSFKVFWSPLVEFYYSEKFGKRKSWIVPTQIVLVVMLYYLKENLEELLITKEI
jgi:MFS transporter, PAT family, solute carrier family 33 (acetyl-CoA transportor), member 1